MAPVKPLELYTDTVRPEWIDYNGHMNVAFYVLAFDYATDAFLDHIGLTDQFKDQTQSTTFILDMNVCYKREMIEADPIRVSTQIINFDEKRIHYLHKMYHAGEGYLAATNEILLAHVNLATRRIAPMANSLRTCVEKIHRHHQTLPIPEEVGRTLGIREKRGEV